MVVRCPVRCLGIVHHDRSCMLEPWATIQQAVVIPECCKIKEEHATCKACEDMGSSLLSLACIRQRWRRDAGVFAKCQARGSSTRSIYVSLLVEMKCDLRWGVRNGMRKGISTGGAWSHLMV
jgi:hypothetical protein